MSKAYKYLYHLPGYLPNRVAFYSKNFSADKLALEAIKDYFDRFYSPTDAFPWKIVLYSGDGKLISEFRTKCVYNPDFIVEKIY